MKERSKPKENWESTIKASRKLFKSEDYQDILTKLKIPFTDETIKEIINIQIQYYAEIQLIDDRPLMSEVRAMMEKIIHHGKKYEEWLRKIDDESFLRMAVIKGDINFMDDIGMPETIDRSLKDVVMITRIAEQVKKKSSGGQHRFKQPIRGYIARLARLFEQTTGRKATVTTDPEFSYEKGEDYSLNIKKRRYKGKFLDFVSSCSEKIPGNPNLAAATLAKLIKEVTSPSHNRVKIS